MPDPERRASEEEGVEVRPAQPPPEAEPMGTESPRIFDGAIEVGSARLRNSVLLMTMNGLIGGLFVTFSGLGAFTALAAFRDLNPDVAWLLAGLLYPIGFIFVILGKSELFTENFVTPVLATWESRARAGPLLRLWGVTLAANLAGVIVMAAAWAYPPFALLPDGTRAAFVHLAEEELARPWLSTLAKGVIAGMLINLMSWLVIAARGPLTKLAMMFIPAYLIFVLRAAHSVVGSFDILVGIFAGAEGDLAGWALRFLAPAALGNMLGGVVFVSALHYAQVREARRVQNGDDDE